MNEGKGGESKKGSRWVWFLVAAAVVTILQLASGGSRSSPRLIDESRPSDNLPNGVLMDAREKALYDADPSSMGYTEEDRQFMAEHGVSEAEMRAAESVIGNPD